VRKRNAHARWALRRPATDANVKSPSNRGEPWSEGLLFRWRDSIVWFDTALARGPVDFPYPCRNGPGSGASEFVEATVAASDPATDLSLPNIRQATLRWRPTGEHRVRDW